MVLNKSASYRRATVSLVALIGALNCATPSLAQDAPADNSAASGDVGMQEIIVTAQKRSQRLSDVGISIVAQTAEQLQSAGVTDAMQLGKVTPGLVASQSQSGYSIFSIRGVNFNSNQISAAPTVSTYVDEAALPLPAMTGALLLDVERIEILKGPQGTLFGQNATGGSINVIAAKPTSTPSAGLRGEVNHFGQVFAEGFVSGPLSDTLRVRLSGQTTQFGTWQYSRYNSEKNGDQNKGAARLLVDWEASPSLKISLNLNANYDHGEPQAPQFLRWNLQVPPPGIPLGGGEFIPSGAYPNYLDQTPSNKIRVADTPAGFSPKNHHRQYQAVLRAELEVDDNNTITSITNYIDTKFYQRTDFNASFLPVFLQTNDATARSFGQELRLNGSVPSANLTYIVGGNYQNNSPMRSRFTFDLVHYSVPFLPPGTQVSTDLREGAKSIGGFANADWEFLPGLTLTGGARYTEVTERFSGCAAQGDASWTALQAATSEGLRGAVALDPLPDGTFVPGECSTLDYTGFPDATFEPFIADESRKETNWSWRAGLNYKPSADSLLYGLVSRGYKSGLFPVLVGPVSTQFPYVTQEQLTSYEGGVKLSLLDRRVQLELSGFYYDYKNKQLFTYTQVPPFGAVFTAANIPKSSVKGVDISLRAEPVPGWTISGGATYAKSKIKKEDPNVQGYDLLGQPVPLVGNEFNFSPDWSGTADTQYSFPTSGDLTPFVGGSMRFASKSYSDLANSSVSTLRGFTVFDVRAGVESDKGWNLSVWSRNVGNKLYETNVVATGDAILRYLGMPRTFGASFGVRF